MASIVTLDELKGVCDWTFDEDEDRVALNYLSEASDLVCAYGLDSWTTVTAPRLAKNVVKSAVRRFMRNPDGYVTSRAGDETVAWAENSEAGSIYLTPSEIKLIRGLAGQTGIRSATAKAWGTTKRYGTEQYTVPVSGYEGEKAFPYFGDPTEPW